MRRRLILVFIAISTMVALAFVIPLGFLVRRTAEDRAVDAARADAAAVAPSLAAGGTRAQIESAIGATAAGREQRMIVVTSNGWQIGEDAESPLLDAALASGASGVTEVDDGVEVVAAVATGPGELSAVRVFVADDELRRGQWAAWLSLGGVGLVLIGISVAVADQLARSIVRPTERLAVAAHRLGAGDLDATVTPDGPPELVELAKVFNELGTHVGVMLDRERELIAELSHRLRTPLAKLRLRLDQVSDPEVATALHEDINDLTTEVNALIDEARGALVGTEECDAGPVVAERAEFWSVLAEDQARPWRFEPADTPLRVGLGAESLAATVDVLLENVFAHTDDGVPIEAGIRSVGPEVVVFVNDGGPGIDAVGEDESYSGRSTGLGLSIARTTAEKVGGSIEVTTSHLGGASVVIRLPQLT